MMNSSFYANNNNHFRKKIQFDLIVWTYQCSNANGITAFNGSQTLLNSQNIKLMSGNESHWSWIPHL